MEGADSRSDTGACPRLAEVADGRSVASEYEVIRLLAHDESRQQFAHAGRHIGFSWLAVFAGFEPDGIPEQVHLSAAHGTQFSQTKAEGVRGFDKGPEPESGLRALVGQTCVTVEFEKALSGVALLEHGDVGQSFQLAGSEGQPQSPFQNREFAIQCRPFCALVEPVFYVALNPICLQVAGPHAREKLGQVIAPAGFDLVGRFSTVLAVVGEHVLDEFVDFDVLPWDKRVGRHFGQTTLQQLLGDVVVAVVGRLAHRFPSVKKLDPEDRTAIVEDRAGSAAAFCFRRCLHGLAPSRW